MRQPVVSCRNLLKQYGSTRAVDGLTFNVGAGTVYALLGRNGAGKTTTVGMLTTLIRPNGGTATVAGWDVVRNPERVRERVGVVLQESALDRYLSLKENLVYLARAYHLPRRAVKSRVDETLEMMGLTGLAAVPVDRLSGGNRRRAEICAGFLHRPAVLLLDEPTVGLDVEARQTIYRHVAAVKETGTAVILTTHYLEEADRLADQVGILDRGRLVREGPPAALKAELNRRELLVVGAAPPADWHDRWAGWGEVGRVQEGVRVRLFDGVTVEEALTRLGSDLPPGTRSVAVGAASLDDVFLDAVSTASGEEQP